MNFVIENDVPMPTKRILPSKYPFSSMQVGQSIATSDRQVARRLRSAAASFASSREWRFSLMRTETGWRLWRVS